jgi:hypothetical protein
LSEIDFTTALGRLLQDGSLRDAFATDPTRTLQQMDVRAADRAALQGLAPADLEFQARVLLRKRFDLTRALIPLTCARMGDRAWDSFAGFARAQPPEKTEPARRDALRFCEFHISQPNIVFGSELNRLRFVLNGARFALHWVPDQPINGRPRSGLQILWRRTDRKTRETFLYCGW